MQEKRYRLGDSHSCVWLCLLALVAMLFAGCGGANRHAVDGTVTFGGAALEKGYISLRPQPGTTSPSAGGDIVNGRFLIAAEGGLLPGKFRAEITASRITDKKIRDPIRGMVPLEEQFIPAKYNTTSQLEITIPPDSGRITKNFDLAK